MSKTRKVNPALLYSIIGAIYGWVMFERRRHGSGCRDHPVIRGNEKYTVMVLWPG